MKKHLRCTENEGVEKLAVVENSKIANNNIVFEDSTILVSIPFCYTKKIREPLTICKREKNVNKDDSLGISRDQS